MNTYGSVCWWCYWGWPKQISDIYTKAVEALGGDNSPLVSGPAHAVWSDENWDAAQRCLDSMNDRFEEFEFSAETMAVVRQSLVDLLAVPDDFKEEPSEYEGFSPSKFPPPAHWEMVKC
jgi:hypothetical protein